MNGSMSNNQGIGTKTEIIDSKDSSTLIMQNQSMSNANQQQQQHHQQMLSTTGVLQQPQQQQPQQSQVFVLITNRLRLLWTDIEIDIFSTGAVVINKLFSITKLSAHCAIQYVKLLFYVSSRLCFSIRVHGAHTKSFY